MENIIIFIFAGLVGGLAFYSVHLRNRLTKLEGQINQIIQIINQMYEKLQNKI